MTAKEMALFAVLDLLLYSVKNKHELSEESWFVAIAMAQRLVKENKVEYDKAYARIKASSVTRKRMEKNA